MLNAKSIVLICGFYSIGFAIFHLFFWKLFDWKNDLKKLKFGNKAIMQILNIRLIYVFSLVAVICFCFPEELCTTPLGRFFIGGVSLFWLGRTIEQFIFLRVKSRMINILTVIFIIGIALFALPLFLK